MNNLLLKAALAACVGVLACADASAGPPDAWLLKDEFLACPSMDDMQKGINLMVEKAGKPDHAQIHAVVEGTECRVAEYRFLKTDEQHYILDTENVLYSIEGIDVYTMSYYGFAATWREKPRRYFLIAGLRWVGK